MGHKETFCKPASRSFSDRAFFLLHDLFGPYALLARPERPGSPSGHPYECRKSHDGDSIGFAAGDDAILAAASKILS
jgi:hypothetical protein